MARTEPTAGPDAARRWRALRSSLRLVRWENCLFAFGATAIGFTSARPPHAATGRLALAGAVVALVLAFGNVVNDLCDEEVDRWSKPWRPLPSGRVTRRWTSSLAVGLAMAAVAAALPLGWGPFAFAVAMLVLAYEYSVRLKGVPVIGNVVVAVQVGSTILFGALCAGEPTGTTLIGSLLVLLYSLTLEVAKTVEDHDADRAAGLTTIAHLLARPAHGAAVLALAATCASAAIGYGVALDAPLPYWLVLAPLVPLGWLGMRWHVSPPPLPAPVRRLVGASKGLWCLALLGLAVIT